MQPRNLVVVMSDSHSRDALGCHGHPAAITPHLDALAARGTRFSAAYSATPLCCPARAAFATGRFPHQSGYWDNTLAYDGRHTSWMHRLRDAGRTVTSIGKLHFRSGEDDTGFCEQILPMHILNGIGGVVGLLRWNDSEPERTGHFEMYTNESGVGGSAYLDYDKAITRATLAWLETRAAASNEPFTLFVSYACPHPPFMVEQRHWDLYDEDSLPLPPQWRPQERPEHPAAQALHRKMGFRDIDDPAVLRKATRAYLAAVSHLDEQIGLVVQALDDLGLTDDTRIVYTSDHGESLGHHALLGKCSLYESAIAVPLIMAGPDVAQGQVIERPVSHVDLFPTILEAQDVPPSADDAELLGRSLWPLLRGEAVDARPVFAEYHGTASRSGAFMLRDGNDKLIHHAAFAPQLFDLDADPYETRDLASEDPATVARLQACLHTIVDPEDADARARADQRAMAESLGGDDAIRARGAFPFTPPPGTDARMVEVR